MFDLRSVTFLGVAFVAGGLAGFALVRTWWSALALYAVGFVFVFLLAVGFVPGWFFWIFGVSAGSGVRGLIHRRRALRASFLSRPG